MGLDEGIVIRLCKVSYVKYQGVKMAKTVSTFRDQSRRQLQVGDKTYDFFSIAALAEQFPGVKTLPFSIKVLLENLLRNEDGDSVTAEAIETMASMRSGATSDQEIAYRPARVLMQDFTGVPAVVDLAAMRDAMVAMGGDPDRINPLSPVDLVIDHSVMVDHFGSANAFAQNVDLEMQRNLERYVFLQWGSKVFKNFRVVPPGTGICHQVNVEYLAQVVWTNEQDGVSVAYPDTCVGTDSHTTMVGGMAVLGWGVGGIEAEAAMLGQPISMLVPDVIGLRLHGHLKEGVTATDLVLRVTEMLRQKGVVGKFVEFCGDGLDHLSLADRATIANMAPEYGATCGFFPIDSETINYLRLTARDEANIALVEAYAKAQGMWREPGMAEPNFTEVLELDLSSIVPSLAGPKRPQDRVALTDASASIAKAISDTGQAEPRSVPVPNQDYHLTEGDVAIAAITSCTNTSNPSVLVAAGLVARAARQRGLKVKPWVKTSLAPGSQVVTDYLNAAGLQEDLDALGFNLVGYGCTTCIGNSGPLPADISKAINDHDLVVASVLSGNRNFEGRVSPDVIANYLASPPLVVAYALAGNMRLDITRDSLGEDSNGQPVYLKDIWPDNATIKQVMESFVTPDMFASRYRDVFKGTEEWAQIKSPSSQTFEWDGGSTYVRNPPYFEGMTMTVDPHRVQNITGARLLAKLGDSITTDHISPAGSIRRDGPAGDYLSHYQVRPVDFNSYGSRRGNHEVMMRGTFANIRLRNELAPGTTGGVTRMPDGTELSIYDAAMRYAEDATPLLVMGGKEYGTGSSRDWAAKGTALLGIKAVIVESFERIHRSNLIGMGILPLQFPEGVSHESLNIRGDEVFDLTGLDKGVSPKMTVTLTIRRADGKTDEVPLLCRIDTEGEAEYYRHGGILPYVLRGLAA